MTFFGLLIKDLNAMMLHVVLDALDLESVIGLVHRYYNSSEIGTKHPTSDYLLIPDEDILKDLLPHELFQLMMNHRRDSFYSFAFGLRHQLSYLNFLFHLQTLEHLGRSIDYTQSEKVFDRDICRDRVEVSKMIDARH
jgi:hypothetical protein